MSTTPAVLGLRRMAPRNPAELFRTASPLELFFDLIFVVAVSLSSAQLFHGEASGSLGPTIVSYLVVFFAIWWAWMNFTWFASAFDTDDWLYRLLVLAQMAGAIVLAVGTGPAMRDGDLRVVIAGYVIMRIALVIQWLRASRSHPALRGTAIRYAIGVTLVQVLWVGFPLLPVGVVPAIFPLLVVCELVIPAWAEHRQPTPWHPGHIVDRYGCFTMIVLGESVLASTTAVATALGSSDQVSELVLLGFAGFVLAAGMWWAYFSVIDDNMLTSRRQAFLFGYGHYFVFGAAGAFSAGISVLLATADGTVDIPYGTAVASLLVPVALYLFGVWGLILRHHLSGLRSAAIPLLSLAIALTPLLAGALESVVWPVLIAAGLMAVLIAVIESAGVREFPVQGFAEQLATEA